MYTASPPQSEQELMQRAAGLSGKTLGQIARQMGISVPPSQSQAKGWAGALMESYLGATAASLSEPDFQLLGVELKTIPLGANRLPKESTYVCTVPLTNNQQARWETSSIRRKLACVLWLPIEAEKSIPLRKRRIGHGLLWRPDKSQEAALRRDFQELMDMVLMGELEKLSSHHGSYLQIRPKAANARALTRAINAAGEAALTLPRGFYLRPAFTRQILKK